MPDIFDARQLVGLAGTVTTAAAVEIGLAEYDRDAIHHFRSLGDHYREGCRALAPGGRLCTVTHSASLMREVAGDTFSGSVQGKLTIDTELKRILNADRDAVFAVKNEQGDTIGALSRELVVDLLATSKA